MSDRFVRESECREMTGLSRTTRRRKERAGLFPKPYKISPGIRAYKESEILAWLEGCVKEVDHE